MNLCKKCGESSQSEFYASLKTECKKCTRERVKKNRDSKSEYYKEFDRKRSNNPERVELRKKIAERWKKDPKLRKRNCELKKAWTEKNKVKRAAHMITANAIKSGMLIKQSCCVCGENKSEAHHEDYNYPMDVVWYCRKHHAERHKIINEERRISHATT